MYWAYTVEDEYLLITLTNDKAVSLIAWAAESPVKVTPELAPVAFWLIVTVEPEILVTKVPDGMLVPLIAIPIVTPVVLPTDVIEFDPVVVVPVVTNKKAFVTRK